MPFIRTAMMRPMVRPRVPPIAPPMRMNAADSRPSSAAVLIPLASPFTLVQRSTGRLAFPGGPRRRRQSIDPRSVSDCPSEGRHERLDPTQDLDVGAIPKGELRQQAELPVW